MMASTQTATDSTNARLVRKYFEAYEQKDRNTAEELIARDLTFISPFDDSLDRAQFFEKVWPQSERIKSVTIEQIFEYDEHVFVLYELHAPSGITFRNTEFIALHNGQIRRIEVFFGKLPPELLAEAQKK
jgi:ketosteroid isomerase-like protein